MSLQNPLESQSKQDGENLFNKHINPWPLALVFKQVNCYFLSFFSNIFFTHFHSQYF